MDYQQRENLLGVLENKDTYYYGNIVYVKYKCGRGVRKDGVVYKVFGRMKRLHSGKPCICGSLEHARTTNIDCPLNPRYSDK